MYVGVGRIRGGGSWRVVGFWRVGILIFGDRKEVIEDIWW